MSNKRELAQFFRQMAVLTSSGLSLHRGLETCAAQTSWPLLRKHCLRLSEDLRHGVRLSAALGKAGYPFSGLHGGVILAAETTGRYDDAFEQLAVWEEKGDAVERKIRSLVNYPLLVVGIACVGTFALLRFLAPLVKSVSEQVGGTPSLPSQVVMVAGEITGHRWFVPGLLLASVLGFWSFRRASGSARVQQWWEQWSLCLPVVGNLLWKAWLVRVARCLQSLLDAGLPMVRSIELAADATGNRFLGQHVLQSAAFGVRKGECLSQALPQDMMSKAFMGMLSVGETSGALPEMLARVADLYEVELSAEVETLFRATEPILMGVVGLMVLACLLCAFQPLYGLLVRL